MKWLISIAFLTILLSCKQSETTSNTVISTDAKSLESTANKATLFLSMERTPCLGKCPNYKITIMNNGKVTYEGFDFTEKIGFYKKQLSAKQLSKIKKQIESIGLFEMENKYNGKVTDIPAVSLFVIYKGNKKKIFDRYGGPKDLRDFEKLIDTIVIDEQLIKMEKE